MSHHLPKEILAMMERISRELEEGPPRAPELAEGAWLDEVLASRSHVRLLRVLALLGDTVNLTGRDLARRAGVSHPRTIEVMSSLARNGIVTRYREATWSIYELNKDSPHVPAIRALFEAERDLTPT